MGKSARTRGPGGLQEGPGSWVPGLPPPSLALSTALLRPWPATGPSRLAPWLPWASLDPQEQEVYDDGPARWTGHYGPKAHADAAPLARTYSPLGPWAHLARRHQGSKGSDSAQIF